MFVMLLVGSFLLFSGLWYIIYFISKRTQNLIDRLLMC